MARVNQFDMRSEVDAFYVKRMKKLWVARLIFF